MNAGTLRVQNKLIDIGYQPGPADGVRGRMTINAVKQFQRAHGLTADGLVGPMTFAKLFGIQDVAPEIDATPWGDEANRVMGLHEIHDKSKLMKWLMSDGGGVGDPSKTPWCGDYIQTSIALSMPEEPLPNNPYLAANWVKFGIECEPQPWAILSFWRGSPDSWKGHVGFYAGETDTHYYVKGGNQSNAVTRTFIEKKRLRPRGCRWPSTGLKPTGGAVIVARNGAPVSVNEA